MECFFSGTNGVGSIHGSSNVGVGGNNVLGLISTGSYNTVIGHSAGQKISTGNNNIIIGYNSGSGTILGIQNGTDNILIGNEVNTTASNSTFQLNIGNLIYGNLTTPLSIGIGSNTLTSMFNVGTAADFQVSNNGKFPRYGGATPANGQLLIGDGTDMELATLTGGSGINTNNGSGTITLDMDINELTAEADIAVADDYVPFYDASKAANNKLNIETLLAQYVTSYRKNRFDYYNEFINGISTAGGSNDIIASSNGSGAGSTATSATSATNVVGLVRSQTGTDMDGRTSCATYNSAILLGGGQWTYELRINGIAALSDAYGDAEIYQLLVGFYDVNSAQNQSDGVYFLYDRAGVSVGSASSANWQLVTSSNATRTFTTSSTTVSTGASTLKIIINAAGTSADFYINNTNIGTLSTNIPTGTNRATGFGWMLIKSAGTTNRAMEIDYLSVQCDYTTSK
ncbi:MAG: hypothetical protein ACK4IY_00370 [Chitinophagales bacterium]